MTIAELLLEVSLAAAWLVAVYFLYSAAQLALGCEWSVRWLRAGSDATATAARPGRLVLLCPMLREEAIVGRALVQFLDLVRSGVIADVVVIGTVRERAQRQEARTRLEAVLTTDGCLHDDVGSLAQLALDRAAASQFLALLRGASPDRDTAREFLRAKSRPLTVEVARATAEELNRESGRDAFFVLEAPAEAVGKVGQMNAGLAWWKAHRASVGEQDVYIGVYDADSQPDSCVFGVIHQVISCRRATGVPLPAVLQQVSCYCQNLDVLRGLAGALSTADALAQTRWALGFELPLYAGYSAAVRSGRLRRLVYCVGHGCFVSLTWLNRIGGFPTCSPNDDLALGYLASLAGEEVFPLPVLDFCDVAPSPLATISQSRFWFLGSARFHRDLAFFRAAFGHRPGLLQRLLLALDGRLRNFCWAWRPVFWLAAVLFAVVSESWVLLGVLLTAHFLYVQFGLVHTISVLGRLPGAGQRVRLSSVSGTRLLTVVALASVTFLLRGLGPMLGSIGIVPRHASKIER